MSGHAYIVPANRTEAISFSIVSPVQLAEDECAHQGIPLQNLLGLTVSSGPFFLRHDRAGISPGLLGPVYMGEMR